MEKRERNQKKEHLVKYERQRAETSDSHGFTRRWTRFGRAASSRGRDASIKDIKNHMD